MELPMRMHATGIQCRFVGWSLLSSTQTDDADVLGTRVLAWLHYRDCALTQLLVIIARTETEH